MSELVDQVIEVLDDIWTHRPSLWRLRREAVLRVAKRHAVHANTVSDKLGARKLGASSLSEFDTLVGKWLNGDSEPLRRLLLDRAITDTDKARVNEFFMTRGS